MAEFEARKCSSRLEDPVSLLQDGRDRRAVADAKRNRVKVISIVLELLFAQVLSIGLVEGHLRG